MGWVTSKADASSMDQNGPLEVPLQVKKKLNKLYSKDFEVAQMQK